MPKKHGKRMCDFCPNELGAGSKYIYPVPVLQDEDGEDVITLLHEGKLACADCAPELQQKQFDQGLHTKG
jgi:hypothetical protein